MEPDLDDELWHKRPSHISERGVHMLVVKDLLLEVKGMHLKHCVDFLVGMQNKASFHSRPPMRRKHVLELVHTDVFYMDAKSHHGAQYFVTFINKYKKTLWAFTLKSEVQMLLVFKDCQAKAKRESGHKLKTVWTDNGGEYRGKFAQYYEDLGIKLEYIVPKTHLS